MFAGATPTSPGRSQPQSERDRDLARVLGLPEEGPTGAVTLAALRERGIRAPGQAVYDLWVAAYVIDRVSCIGPDGREALGLAFERERKEPFIPAATRRLLATQESGE